jgi:hypothetical protein
VFVDLGTGYGARARAGLDPDDVTGELPNHVAAWNPGREGKPLAFRVGIYDREFNLKQVSIRVDRAPAVRERRVIGPFQYENSLGVGIGRVPPSIHAAVRRIGCQVIGRVDVLQNTGVIDWNELRRIGLQKGKSAAITLQVGERLQMRRTEHHRVAALAIKRGCNDRKWVATEPGDQRVNRCDANTRHITEREH